MAWLIYVLLATACFTTLNLVQRVISTDSQNPRATAVIFNTLCAGLAVGLFLVTRSWQNFSLPSAPLVWLALLGGVVFYGIFERGRFYAAKFLDASALAIVINLSVLIAFVAAIFLYAEPLTTETLTGGLLVIVSLLLVSYEKQRLALSRQGFLVAVLISVCLGLAWSLDKLGATNFGPEAYSALAWTVGLTLIIFPLIPISEIKQEFKRSSKKIGLISILNVSGYYLMLRALEIADATKVIPLVQTSLLITVFLGILLLKEKERLVQKIIAGILGLIGVFLLV